MQFPNFGYRNTSHARLTPDDRSDVDDGLISTAWNAGTLHVQYVGLSEVSDSAAEKAGETMWRLAADCPVRHLGNDRTRHTGDRRPSIA